ncbi:CHAT domain-containing protein [Streptomyces sp. BK239]|uniref:CHAT domain-containing protein n=1 Tax=Streptomyces sp. BK239 TaxID=2512155 RepID=UPI00102AD84E|nr:CHAT domain-containing protein [Streptomyces sp. BK239]RZU18007.1 CHAT domain-containing protein [Streptomyces sp. BK239]
MADQVGELTIRLDWDGDWSGDLAMITAVVVDGDTPRHAQDAPAPVAKTMLALWQSRSRTSLRYLTEALFPPSTRPHLRDAVSRLRSRQPLRVRLRLPAPAEGQPFSLAELPWEVVQVPAPDAGHGIWNAWVDGSQEAPASSGELGSHERFTLVREFQPQGKPLTDHTYRSVLVADATGVHGTVRTPTREFDFSEPRDPKAAAGDIRAVELALRGSGLKADTLPSPASKQAIRQRLLGGAGAFYFGGHHIEDGLIVADGPGSSRAALLDGDTLSEWLVECRVPLAVLLACDSGGQDEEAPSTSRRLPLAERMVRDGVPHVVAVRGKASHRQAAEFAGSFFASLAAEKDIDVALGSSAHAFAGSTARPVLYSGRGRRMSVALDETPRPTPPGSTDAHRVAQGSEEPALPDERFRVSLETRWTLFTPAEGQPCAYDVLADPSAGDLAGPVNEWEKLLIRSKPGHIDVPGYAPRRWYTFDHDAQGGRLPNGHDELARALGESYRPRPRERHPDDPPHRGIGLVVRKKAAGAMGPGFVRAVQELPKLNWDLRMIVVQLHDPDERVDTVRRAADTVARELKLPEYVVKAHTPGDEGAGGHDVRGGRAGAALLDSLRLAAADDAELDRWLSAVAARQGRLPVPDDFRGLKVPSTVIDAVALALIRGEAPGRKAALAAWANEGLSEPVRWAMDIAAEATDAEEGRVTAQDLSDADRAIALDRAGLLPDRFRQLDPEGLRSGSWALLARRQPTEEDAAWLWGMVPARRRLAGLEPDTGDYDYQLEEDLHECRTAFRPDLPHLT